jgi:serine phosphatase RsbU (regulator of sigma subunit)
MRIRTQLIVAFLILAVVPLSGIVLYSYASSQRALKKAAEADATNLTSEISDRIGSIRTEIEDGLARVGALPAVTLLQATRSSAPADSAPIVKAMGAAAPLVESVEVIADDSHGDFASETSAPTPVQTPAKRTPEPRKQAERPERMAGMAAKHRAIPAVSEDAADRSSRSDSDDIAEASDDETGADVVPGFEDLSERPTERPPAAPPTLNSPHALTRPVHPGAPCPPGKPDCRGEKDWNRTSIILGRKLAPGLSGKTPYSAEEISRILTDAIASVPTEGELRHAVVIPLQRILIEARAGKSGDGVDEHEIRRLIDDAVRKADAVRRKSERDRDQARQSVEKTWQIAQLAIPELRIEVPAGNLPSAPAVSPPAPAVPAPAPEPRALNDQPRAAVPAKRAEITVVTTRPATIGSAKMKPAAPARIAVSPTPKILEAKWREQSMVLGDSLTAPLRDGDKVVGRITAQVSCPVLLQSILARAKRDQGEVPFALSADGHLYSANEEDGKILAQFTPTELRASSQLPASRKVIRDWVVVSAKDPVSGLNFGIARPLGSSLRQMRQTAARNLAYGIGLIGLALLGILPLSRGMTKQLKMVTAGAERIAQGDLTARVPVRSASEFGTLAKAFNRMAKDLSENQQRLVEQELKQRLLHSEYARKTAEIEEARRFQLALLPKSLPQHPNLTIAAALRTATEVGGDYYDFHQDPSGVLTVAIGDATGHGAKAGTMVTAIKSLLSSNFAQNGLSSFLNDSARALHRMGLERMAMALALVRFEPGRITVSSAGMPPVLIYRRASGEVEEVALSGLPLGSMVSDYSEVTLPLGPGDLVLLSTDGLPELGDPSGEPFSYPRVRSVLGECGSESPEEVLAQLNAAAEKWCCGQALRDDLTLLAIQVRSATA